MNPMPAHYRQPKPETKMSPKTMVSPLWYAVGGTLTTPLLSILLVLGAIAMLVLWPVVPVVLFLKRRQEIAMIFGRPPHQ